MDQLPNRNKQPGAAQLIVQKTTRTGLQTYMAQVYGWMACGLFLTAFVAFYAVRTRVVVEAIFTTDYVLLGLIVVQLGLVMVLASAIHKLSATVATSMFMLYAALTGLTISSIFLRYTYESIASIFVVSGAMFAVVSLYGYTTCRDLSRFGSLLFMGLVGVVIASIMNFWLESEALMWTISYIGVAVFIGLTAYDTQKLKSIGMQIDSSDSQNMRRYAILGALELYLDFINLFLLLLRLFGSRR